MAGTTPVDIPTFQGEIVAMSAILGRSISDIIRHTAFDILAEVIPATPVDTGYARANWRISIDQPDQTVSVEPSYLAKRGGSVRSTKTKGWYPMHQPQANDIPQEFEATASVFVTNSVHYVYWLENGTSKRAPLHFIQNAADRVAAKMDAYIQKVLSQP